MTNFDLIGAINSYCTQENIKGLFGEAWYRSYSDSQNEYDNGELVLIADFNCAPKFNKANIVDTVTYTGVIGIGRKFDLLVDEEMEIESVTVCSLDETYMQKYVRRIKELSLTLTNIIYDIACANNLTITNAAYSLDLNKLTTNIDFVVCQITFVSND